MKKGERGREGERGEERGREGKREGGRHVVMDKEHVEGKGRWIGKV